MPPRLTFLGVPFLALVFAAASGKAASEEVDLLSMSLKELLQVTVEVAGKKSQPINKIPQTIHVITRQQIKENGYRNIMEALADKAGFQLQKNWYLDRLIVRGQRFSLDKLLLLVDGQAMAMRSDNYNILNDAGPVDIDDIETIEVLMGPSSTLYGSGAFVGVINIKTQTNTDGFDFTVRAASPDEKGLHLSYGMNVGGYNLSVSASGYDSKGEDLSLTFPGGAPPQYGQSDVVADGYNTLETKRVSFKVKSEQLDLRAQYSNSAIGWPNSLFDTDLNDHGNRYEIEHKSIQIKYLQDYSANLKAQTRAYYTDSVGLWKGVYEGELYLAPDGEEYSGKYYGVEYKLSYDANDSISLVSGVEYTRNSDVRSVSYVDDFNNASLFGMAEFMLFDNFELEFGARVENYSYNDDYEVMPQLGMIYRLNERSHFKAAYSKGFIAPSTWVRQVAMTVNEPNPQPEKLDSLELSFYQQFERLATNLTVYQALQTDNIVIEYDGNTPTYISNSSDQEKYLGIEWSNDLRLSKATSLLFNASYVDARAESKGASSYRLKGIADTTFNTSLRSVFFDSNTFTIQYSYVDKIEGYPEIDSWDRVDLSYYNNDVFGFELTIKLVNVFDKTISTYENSSSAIDVPDRSRHLMMIFSGSF